MCIAHILRDTHHTRNVGHNLDESTFNHIASITWLSLIFAI